VLEAVYLFFGMFIQWNFFLFLFNLIPLPPLDGYRIVEDIAPRPIRGRLQKFEQWAVFLFLLILFIPGLRTYTIEPLALWASDMSLTFVRLSFSIFGG